MKEKEVINKLKINNFKIKTKRLLNQLSLDEILYIHMHLTSKSDFQEMFSDVEYPLNYNEFEITKNKFKFKKFKKENVLNSLLDMLEYNYGKNNIEWLDMEVFFDREKKHDDFYVIIYKLFSDRVLDDFRSMLNSESEDYNLSYLTCSDSKQAEYLCLKSICAIHSAKDYFIMQDILLGDNKPKRSKKKLQQEIMNLQEQLSYCVHENYTFCCKASIEDVENEITRLKEEVKKGHLNIEDKNIKIKELKETLRNVNKQLKDFQKIAELKTLEKDIKNIYNKLDSLEKSNINISKEIKDSKESVLRKSYETQIDNYTTKIADLKRDLNLKSIECKELKKIINDFEYNFEDKIITYIEQNGLSDSIRRSIAPFFNEEENLMEDYINGKFKISSEIEEESEMIIPKSQFKAVKKIGYVQVEDDMHYVVFNNGSKFELQNLTDTVYLADGQFIVVDEDNKFVKTTMSVYEDNGISIKSLNLGTVESVNPLLVRVGEDIIEAKNTNNFNGYYSINQVVGLNEYNQIVRAFRLVKFNADTVLASIKSRNIKIYYVLNIFNGCFSVRDIETSFEELLQLDGENYNISKSSIIFVKDNKIVNAFTKGYFYTCSSLYSGNASFGPVSIVNDVVILKKQSGKSIIVENIPENVNIEEGQIIYVDEFNNYMYTSSTDKVFLEKSIARKTAKQMVNGEEYKKPIKEKGNIVLIGNPYYKNSYVMAFYRNGYKVNILHGYDTNINKIIQEAKNALAVIVSTSYCSHDNFWKIKDEVKKGQLEGVKCLFTQEDGANMLVNKVNELLEPTGTLITNCIN